jgi:hypothetical protein
MKVLIGKYLKKNSILNHLNNICFFKFVSECAKIPKWGTGVEWVKLAELKELRSGELDLLGNTGIAIRICPTMQSVWKLFGC